jgi:hypothetical protein
VYALLIYPYFLSRETSVEGRPRSPEELWDLAQFNPTLLFTVFVGLVFFWSAWSGISKEQWLGHKSLFWTDGLACLLFLGVAPFIYLFFRTQQALRESPESLERERLFKNKVLLPALATCLVSFSLGWAVSNPTSALICMAVPGTLIVILKEVSVRFFNVPQRWFVYAITLLLFVCFISFLVTGSKIGKVMIIGVILTLAMGVAEVCKRVVRFPRSAGKIESRDGYSNIENFDFYLAGSKWGSIIFPLLVCLIPLIVDELPILPIFIVLAVQYLHWHFFTPRKASEALFWFNVILGFMLPSVIVAQYVYPIGTTLLHKDFQSTLYGLVGAAFAFAAVPILIVFGRRLRRLLSGDLFKNSTYRNSDNCFLLFLAVLFIETLVIMLMSVILDATSAVPDIAMKASETVIDLLMLLIVASPFYSPEGA